MIKDINDIEYNQNELNKCNKMLEEIWNDSSAEHFKASYQVPIMTAGTAFVAESLGHIKQLNQKLGEIENLKYQFQKITNELSELCRNPSWKGCGIGIVEGHDSLNPQLHGPEFFVIPKDEMHYINDKKVLAQLAWQQVRKLQEYENPRYYLTL